MSGSLSNNVNQEHSVALTGSGEKAILKPMAFSTNGNTTSKTPIWLMKTGSTS